MARTAARIATKMINMMAARTNAHIGTMEQTFLRAIFCHFLSSGRLRFSEAPGTAALLTGLALASVASDVTLTLDRLACGESRSSREEKENSGSRVASPIPPVPAAGTAAGSKAGAEARTGAGTGAGAKGNGTGTEAETEAGSESSAVSGIVSGAVPGTGSIGRAFLIRAS